MSLARIATNSKQLYWGQRYDNNGEMENENQRNDKKIWDYRKIEF